MEFTPTNVGSKQVCSVFLYPIASPEDDDLETSRPNQDEVIIGAQFSKTEIIHTLQETPLPGGTFIPDDLIENQLDKIEYADVRFDVQNKSIYAEPNISKSYFEKSETLCVEAILSKCEALELNVDNVSEGLFDVAYKWPEIKEPFIKFLIENSKVSQIPGFDAIQQLIQVSKFWLKKYLL
ncbi:hypothetical protein C1645_834206 [Glomus cerebriforme]|uniref:Uncharacterized protein n=1 Tax=Glomus cerebriforme TaxID=658196 RepID=A0A397SA01_9GLOM|nr:hypothetical protein C1645_834206 [Glomus cerebriforme]